LREHLDTLSPAQAALRIQAKHAADKHLPATYESDGDGPIHGAQGSQPVGQWPAGTRPVDNKRTATHSDSENEGESPVMAW
jgi:hypothetical protein